MNVPGADRRGRGKAEMMMTPMIDIVFNLIIFFMLVSQISSIDKEPVQLPPAAMADPMLSKTPQFEPVVINVVAPDLRRDPGNRTTLVKIGGQVVMKSEEGGDIPDPEALESLLKARQATSGQPGGMPVNVILRADESVPYDLVGRIMIAASHADIPHWWVQAARPSPTPGQDVDVKRFLGVVDAQTE